MKRARWVGLLLGLWAGGLVTLSGTNAEASGYAYQHEYATPLGRATVYLQRNHHYAFRTTSLSQGADTVMDLYGPNISGVQAFVAYNDDASPGVPSSYFTYDPPSNISGPSTYEIYVRNYDNFSGGTCNIEYSDNGGAWVTLATATTFGGRIFTRPTSANLVVQTAIDPGGTSDTILYGFQYWGGPLIAFDDDGGVGWASRLPLTSSMQYVVLSSFAASGSGGPGSTSVYFNDTASDSDGDGLGAGLEADVGTCDSKQASGCAAVFNTVDSDRDGIEDQVELLGIDEAFPQQYPAWGARPNHKDIFVHVSYNSNEFTSNPVQPSDLAYSRTAFAQGPASALQNPDGADGVDLHFDLGTDPSPGDSPSWYGNWGTSHAYAGTDPGSALVTLNPTSRQRRFREALFLGTGNGAGGGDSLVWVGTTTDRRPADLAHELGHTVSIQHWGHNSWGLVNGKPNYPSIMNYGVSNPASSAFSLGYVGLTLNGAALDETVSYVAYPTFVSRAASSPFYVPFDTSSRPDWNRDGRRLTGNVRGLPNLMYNVNNNVDSKARELLQQAVDDAPAIGLPNAAPRLVRYNNFLYLVYTKPAVVVINGVPIASNEIKYSRGVVVGLANGSCPGGASMAVYGTNNQLVSPASECTTWQEPETVLAATDYGGWVEPAAAVYDGKIVVSAHKKNSRGDVVIASTSVDLSGHVTWGSPVATGGVAQTSSELVVHSVDPSLFGGASQLLSVVYVEGNVYKMRTATSPIGPWTERAMLDEDTGQSIVAADGTHTSVGAALTQWPAPGWSGYNLPAPYLCGVLPSATNEVSFYCYNRATDRWRRNPNIWGLSATKNRMAIAFHVPRTDGGYPVDSDPTAGQFVLVYRSFPSIMRYKVLQTTDINYAPGVVSASNPPLSNAWRLKQSDALGNQWGSFDVGGAAVYEDGQLGGMKGAAIEATFGNSLVTYPFFDGGVNGVLRDGNDFMIMERGVCMEIRGDASFCGTASTSVGGY